MVSATPGVLVPRVFIDYCCHIVICKYSSSFKLFDTESIAGQKLTPIPGFQKKKGVELEVMDYSKKESRSETNESLGRG